MKNKWLMWVFVVGVIITVFIAFNHQGGKGTVPLSEIFQEEETFPVDIEYEFVDDQKQAAVPSKEKETAASTSKIIEKVKVSETKPVPAPAPTPVSSSVASSGQKEATKNKIFTIQVYSLKNMERAQKILQTMKEKGHPAYLISRDLGEKGVWHRVNVGEFDTKEAAQAFLSEFKKEYNDSFIMTLSK